MRGSPPSTTRPGLRDDHQAAELNTRPERTRPVPQTTAFRNAVTSVSHAQTKQPPLEVRATEPHEEGSKGRRLWPGIADATWEGSPRQPCGRTTFHRPRTPGHPVRLRKSHSLNPAQTSKALAMAPEHPLPQSPAWSRGPFSHTQTAPGLVRAWPRHREGKGTVPRSASSSGMERWKAVVDVISPGYAEG